MKVVFYAHKWHYVDNYSPIIEQLRIRGIDFSILILWPRNDNYEKYKKEYGDTIIEPYYTKWGKFFSNPSNKIPRIFRHTIKSAFFLYTLNRVFKRNKYDILIASDDRAITHCLAVSAAKSAGLSTLIYPVESILFVDDFLADRVNYPPKPTFASRAMLAISNLIFAKNIKNYKNDKICRYRPREVLELYPLNMLSQNPWVRGANKRIDFVAVNSQIQKEEDCKNSDVEKKTRITGFPPHDILYSDIKDKKSIQKTIFNRFSIPNKKIFLIIGLHYHIPAYNPSEYGDLDREFNEILRILISELNDEYNLVLKVHPQRSLIEQQRAIEEKYRDSLTLLKDDFSSYELIAASDVVMNFFSSTTISALATDNPIFCYHLLKKTSPFQKWLSNFQSIVFIANTRELISRIKELKGGSLHSNFIQNHREQDRNLYGKFDGQNTERFISLLGLILATKSKGYLRP